QNSLSNKKDTSSKSESSTTSKYDSYVKGEDTEDAGIYSSKKINVDEDGYRYRTRQEKQALKAKKKKSFSFNGAFGLTATDVISRLSGNNGG
ncbi:MAG: hypothetical protein K2H23_01475, partial [Oscillospiraceae bacterium]|nr:hypothetical protein [Oscillospiraceae bacterium]